MEKPLNLIFPLPSDTYAYPVWYVDTLSDRYRPDVLTVADSYYWNIFNTRIPEYLFSDDDFWYFNAKVYPATYKKETWVKDLDLRKEVEKRNVIFLMVTERFLYKFDWSFVDMVYKLYAPGWLIDPVYDNTNRIFGYEPWFLNVMNKATEKHISLAESLHDDALYLYFTEEKPSYLIQYGLEHYEKMIRANETWYDSIKAKAGKKDLTVDDQLRIDADYIFRQDNPDLYEIYQGIQGIIHNIYSIPKKLDSLEIEADAYGWPLKDFIPVKAREIYRERAIRQTEHAIWNTPDWLADVKAKAFAHKIPLDEMIRLDAEYVWEQRLKGK